ncbi:MAG: hypothetical protein U0T73_05005 [Chitinophagales bacterium]
MNRKFVFGTLLTALLLLSFAYEKISSVPSKAKFVVADSFGNFYAAENNSLRKFDKNGVLFSQPYQEFKRGNIGSVDVSNAMKITVYYPDFQTAVTLDRFLSPLTTYDFTQLGYQNITAVGSSTDGKLWFFDNVDYKLKKIDESGKVLIEGQPLNQAAGKIIVPNFLMEKNGNVYVNDTAEGICVFDLFGTYARTIPIKGLKRFQVFQGAVVYFEDHHLKSYNPATFEAKEILLPDTSALVHAAIEKERIVLLRDGQMEWFRYP